MIPYDKLAQLQVYELDHLAEFSCLLHPGGVLLTSRGTEESGRRANVKGTVEFSSPLEECGFEQISIRRWWELYDRVMAVKRGSSNRMEAKGLSELLSPSLHGALSPFDVGFYGSARKRNCV